MAIKIMTYQNIALKIRAISFCLINPNLKCLSMGRKDWHLTWKRTMSFLGSNGTLPVFNCKWTHTVLDFCDPSSYPTTVFHSSSLPSRVFLQGKGTQVLLNPIPQMRSCLCHYLASLLPLFHFTYFFIYVSERKKLKEYRVNVWNTLLI